MNREYDEKQRSSGCYREVWDEYGRIRDELNAGISELAREIKTPDVMPNIVHRRLILRLFAG